MYDQIETRTLPGEIPNLYPVVREVPADLDTPVSVYLKLAGDGPSFLLESVTGGEQVARYSFIGTRLRTAYVSRGRTLAVHTAQGVERFTLEDGHDPLDYLRQVLRGYSQEQIPGLPRFSGGLVGYLGYETVAFFEPSVRSSMTSSDPDGGAPDAILLLADTLVAFDHAFGRMLLIANTSKDEHGTPDLAGANARLDELQARLEAPLPVEAAFPTGATRSELNSNTTQQAYQAAVRKAKEHIAAGDIFQVVLSQRLARKTQAAPFRIYRELRRLNPSPYMFYFDFADLAGDEPLRLIGASPEMHVRLEQGVAAIRPIAGTRPRGQTPQDDQRLEQELLADPKERAEHVMLVDLARNDLGRVCEYGTVHVPELMQVERYSHVMHIVSHVEGHLSPDYDAFDLMRATFPAGTVSGAPKVRAMQIIGELEGERRGPYAGAVGYFSFDGTMDTCILIRSLVMQGSTISVQAGAGIVADSDPEREYQETMNKARALAVAIARAEGL
ncbi:MAG: anthranilate synthase component I [Anaerolineales bacterium]|jgi:anthranilate synthase component 1